MKSKAKFFIIIFCILFTVFLYYKYHSYKNEYSYLEKNFSILTLENSNFNFFFSKWFESKGVLPEKSEIEKYISESTNYKKLKLDYLINTNKDSSYVEIFAKKSYNKEGFDNLVKINHIDDGLKDFTFWNYLTHGNFTLLIYSNRFKFNCDRENKANHIFVTSDDNFIINDAKLANKLDVLLNDFGLRLSNYNDKAITTLLYSKEGLKIECNSEKANLPDKLLDEIKNILDINFSTYSNIKFSTTTLK